MRSSAGNVRKEILRETAPCPAAASRRSIRRLSTRFCCAGLDSGHATVGRGPFPPQIGHRAASQPFSAHGAHGYGDVGAALSRLRPAPGPDLRNSLKIIIAKNAQSSAAIKNGTLAE
jgi:hypothetical protein